MNAGDRLKLAAQARDNIARVIELLERPGVKALEDGGAELLLAIARMMQIQNAGCGGGAALKSALMALRSDLDRAKVLLSHAWEFRVGLTGQAGYSNQGALTLPAVQAGRWLFEA